MIGAAPERRALRRAPAVQDRHFSRYVTFQPGHAGGYLTTPRLFGLSSGLKQLHSLAIDAAGVSIGSMTRGLCEGAFEVAKFTERKCHAVRSATNLKYFQFCGRAPVANF